MNSYNDLIMVTAQGYTLTPYREKSGTPISFIEVNGSTSIEMKGNDIANEQYWGFPGLLNGLTPEFEGGGGVMFYNFRANEEGIFRNGGYAIKMPTEKETVEAVSALISRLASEHRQKPAVLSYNKSQYSTFDARAYSKGAISIKEEYEFLEGTLFNNGELFEGVNLFQLDLALERMAYAVLRARNWGRCR